MTTLHHSFLAIFCYAGVTAHLNANEAKAKLVNYKKETCNVRYFYSRLSLREPLE